MCNSFYKVHGEVLKFDIDKDVDLLRFNQWIMRKENVSRIDESNERGTFEMTVRTVEKDLGVTFHRARAMIKKFEDLGIIILIRKSRNKSEGSLYAYTTNYENNHTVSRTVSRTNKVSDFNGLVGVDNTTNRTTNRTSKKENKKENKKDIDILAFTPIFNTWNDSKIIVHKKITDSMLKAYRKAKKEYTDGEIVKAIESYREVIEGDFYYSYKFTLEKFLTQGNAISRFVEDGDILVNYLEQNKKAPTPIGTGSNKKYNYSPIICPNGKKYTSNGREIL